MKEGIRGRANRCHFEFDAESYLDNYHGSRTHLGVSKDTVEPKAVEPAEVGGLRHRYEWRIAKLVCWLREASSSSTRPATDGAYEDARVPRSQSVSRS